MRVSGIILVEAGARLLPSFPDDLSDDATRRLEQLGVEVRLGAPVTAIDSLGVKIGPARIEARTVIWAAGVAASPAGHWIGAKCDRVGRIEVDPDLSVLRPAMGHLATYRQARNRFFATVTPPAAPAVTLVEVSRLYGPDFLIEIESVAAV
jgi:NADH dehydrogenase FAD-containing subunit